MLKVELYSRRRNKSDKCDSVKLLFMLHRTLGKPLSNRKLLLQSPPIFVIENHGRSIHTIDCDNDNRYLEQKYRDPNRYQYR